MRTGSLTRHFGLLAGGVAVVTMGALTAGCGTSAKEEPKTTQPSTTAPSPSAPTVIPSEKAVGPGGTNSFSPSINPQPPGPVCKDVVNGICIR